jgi:hypothetical protein
MKKAIKKDKKTDFLLERKQESLLAFLQLQKKDFKK